jgi:hypothetical protein
LSPEPPVSVLALQARFTWLQLATVAVRPVGTDGGTMSGVVALATLEYGEEFFPLPRYWTRYQYV